MTALRAAFAPPEYSKSPTTARQFTPEEPALGYTVTLQPAA
jgi:hypothetical protein